MNALVCSPSVKECSVQFNVRSCCKKLRYKSYFSIGMESM